MFLPNFSRIICFFFFFTILCFSSVSPQRHQNHLCLLLLLFPSQIQPVRVCPYLKKITFLKKFRKGLLLATSVIICLSYLTVGVFLKLSFNGLISEDMATQLNFIPMAMVILAYMGLGLGFGVIPGLLAAEKMPVNNR